MNALQHSRQILDTMLGYLGFPVEIEEQEDGPDGPTLQVRTKDSKLLIGHRGDVLENMQYLVNRILVRHMPDAPRIRVDVEFYRAMQEERMLEKVRQQAERVRITGRPVKLDPMNSYYRRLVHNSFIDDPEIQSVTEDGHHRFKTITLKKRA